MKTISKGRESLVVDFNGGFDKDFYFEFGDHTTTTGACSVNFKGQFYIIGGTYIGSDIMGHQYLRQVKLGCKPSQEKNLRLRFCDHLIQFFLLIPNTVTKNHKMHLNPLYEGPVVKSCIIRPIYNIHKNFLNKNNIILDE